MHRKKLFKNMSLTNKLKSTVFSKSEDNESLVSSVSLRNTYIAAYSALLYIVVMGMVTTYSSPATVDMQRPGSRFRNITPQQISWIASLPPLTGVIGNLLSGYVSNKLGRKAVLMYSSASYMFSWLMIAYAPSLTFVYMGRLVSGFCAGICSVAVPAYAVEISTVEIRGLLTAGFQVAFALGVFLIILFGMALRWSWLAVSGAVFVTVGACLMYFMPESPTWLIREGKNTEALKGIRFLKGKGVDTTKEFQKISDNLAEQPQGDFTFKEFLDPTLYKPLAIAIALMFFQQFSGINALMSYSVEIFQTTKGSLDPGAAATTVAAVQVVATAASSMLMDKAGRRLLYITSGSCMTLSLTILGLYSFISKRYDTDLSSFEWVPLVSFMVYIAAFSLGFGPIPFVMTPEMVPIRNRSKLLAIANFFCSFFGFVTTKIFDDMRTGLGDYGVYWTYGFFSLLGALFCWFCLPETKGRTIHEIHRSFSVKSERSTSQHLS